MLAFKHGIAVKFLGATNTRGSRIKLTSFRFKQSVTLSYDYAVADTIKQAWAFLEESGFKPVLFTDNGTGYIVACDEFKGFKDTTGDKND